MSKTKEVTTGRVKVTGHLEPEVDERFRAHCKQQGKSLSLGINDALRQVLFPEESVEQNLATELEVLKQRLTQQSERLREMADSGEEHFRIQCEALGLFARIGFMAIPVDPNNDPQRKQAEASSVYWYRRYVALLSKHIDEDKTVFPFLFGTPSQEDPHDSES